MPVASKINYLKSSKIKAFKIFYNLISIFFTQNTLHIFCLKSPRANVINKIVELCFSPVSSTKLVLWSNFIELTQCKTFLLHYVMFISDCTWLFTWPLTSEFLSCSLIYNCNCAQRYLFPVYLHTRQMIIQIMISTIIYLENDEVSLFHVFMFSLIVDENFTISFI